MFFKKYFVTKEKKPEPKKSMKLYVSYSRRVEKKMVERIVEKLKASYSDVWFDEDSLKPSDNFAFEAQKGIEKADYMICFISNEYIKSKYCRLEFFYAANIGKKCIYILLERIDRVTSDGIYIYLYGDAIRFDAYKHKSETVDDYVNVIFSQITRQIPVYVK